MLNYQGIKVPILKSLLKITLYKSLEYLGKIALTSTSGEHQLAHLL